MPWPILLGSALEEQRKFQQAADAYRKRLRLAPGISGKPTPAQSHHRAIDNNLKSSAAAARRALRESGALRP